MSEQLELYLKGGRYDAVEGLPLELLPAMHHLGELLKSVARDLYFDEHPDRRRVPTRFESSFSPALTQLTGGSASCVVSGWERLPEEHRTHHEAARGELSRLLAIASDPGGEWPTWCSLGTRQQLYEWLHLIDEGETLRFQVVRREPQDSDEAVTVDASSRGNIERAMKRALKGTPSPFNVVGRVVGIQKEPWAIKLRRREGEAELRLPIDPQLSERAQEAFQAGQEHLVLVRGFARAAPHGQTRQIERMYAIERIDGPPIGAQLNELVALPVGWLDEEPESKPPSRAFARDIEHQLWALIEELGCARPFLFAIPDGGVEALWQLSDTTVTVHFSQRPRVVYSTVVHLSAGVMHESPQATSLAKIHGWLKPLIGGPG